MKFFSNPRAKRNTALVVLFAWAFALASGVANACLLQERGTLHHAAVVVPSQIGAPASLATHLVGAASDHDDNAEISTASCLKVCDDGSQSPIKQPSTADPLELFPAILVVSGSAVPTIVLPSLSADVSKPPLKGRPFRYRYSRLTL